MNSKMICWTAKLLRTSRCHCQLRRYTSGQHGSVMDAWQIHQYGSNEELTLSHTARVPAIRDPSDVLVEVHAASVNPLDFKMLEGYGRKARNFLNQTVEGVLRNSAVAEFPLILGRDFSGKIKEIGQKVKRFNRGDEVWGTTFFTRQGSHAQYTVASENDVSLKPRNLSHVDATSLPYVALTTWAAICEVGELKAETTTGKRVLILAGSGGIGTFAIQLMNAWGADVTTTCSTDAVELMASLGANTVIDYKSQNVMEELRKLNRFDLILDPLGDDKMKMEVLHSFKSAKYITITSPLLRNMDSQGVIVGGVSSAATLLCGAADGLRSGKFYRWSFFRPNRHGLERVKKLVENEQVRPVIDTVFNFNELPAAFDKLKAGHTRGKIVIDMKDGT